MLSLMSSAYVKMLSPTQGFVPLSGAVVSRDDSSCGDWAELLSGSEGLLSGWLTLDSSTMVSTEAVSIEVWNFLLRYLRLRRTQADMRSIG